jgi:hypothetical protein
LGEDPAGEVDPEWLATSSPKVEASIENVDLFAAAVPSKLSAAPAWALKLRAFALSQPGVATAFNVVAGAATCVPRAFQDAHRELSALLPTVEVEKGRLDADRKPGTLLGLLEAAAALTAPLSSR